MNRREKKTLPSAIVRDVLSDTSLTAESKLGPPAERSAEPERQTAVTLTQEESDQTLTTLPGQREVPVGWMDDSIHSELGDVSLNDGQFLAQEEGLLRENSDPSTGWGRLSCLRLLWGSDLLLGS